MSDEDWYLVSKHGYQELHAEIGRLRAENAELRKAINAIYAHTININSSHSVAIAVAGITDICRAILAKHKK